MRFPRRVGRALGRIGSRLLVVNLLVLLVPAAGLEFARVYERQLLGALERDMRNQAAIVREVLEQRHAEGTALDDRRHERLLVGAARQTRTRIRVVMPRGVVGDSHRRGPPEGEEPPAPRVIPTGMSDRDPRSVGPPWPAVPERSEVVSALGGTPATMTRIRSRSPSVILFLAEPVRSEGRVVAAVYVTRSTQPVLVELYRIRRGLVQVLVVALGLTVVLTVGLALSISRPLARLVRAARRIARGERGVEVPVAGSGEVRELGEAFAVMTERLDARLRYVADFAADVAHEFKSPLTSIRGAAELLGEGAAEDEEARARFLQNILLDADRLDRLVSRLLELSRLEASDEPMGEVSLREVAERVVARTHDEEEPVELVGDDLWVWGRAPDIERALLNLVENAHRFSPPGEPVTITLGTEGRWATVRVRDRGPGIPPEDRDRVFERFFTTDAERQGTGLGLAIVAAVAHAHGGQVRLEDVPDGASFLLCLPRPSR